MPVEIAPETQLSHYSKIPDFISKRIAAQTRLSKSFIATKAFWNLLLFGIPVWAVFCFGYITSFNFTPQNWIIFSTALLGSTWILLAPLLTMAWEQRWVAFVLSADRKYADQINFESVRRTIVAGLRPLQIIIGMLFAVFCVVLFVVFHPLIADVVEVQFASTVYWLCILTFLIAGYVTGLGIAGVIHTVWAIHRLAEEIDLGWQPYHEDQRGGLAFLSEFSLVTAILFTFGSVVVPCALAIGNLLGPPNGIVIASAVFVYAALILVIFFWPMSMVTMSAVRKKREYLATISKKLVKRMSYFAIEATTVSKSSQTRLEQKQEDVGELIFLYEKIGSRPVVPFSANSGAQAASIGLVPIALAVAQKFLENFFIAG